MSDTGNSGNPFLSANPFGEFLIQFLQTRSCMNTLERSSAIASQQQMSLSSQFAFETARLICQEAKALSDRGLQEAVMNTVMARDSSCSAGWHSVSGVRMPEMQPGQPAASSASGLTGITERRDSSWAKVEGSSLGAEREMQKAMQETIQRMMSQADGASREILDQVSQTTATLGKMADDAPVTQG